MRTQTYRAIAVGAALVGAAVPTAGCIFRFQDDCMAAHNCPPGTGGSSSSSSAMTSSGGTGGQMNCDPTMGPVADTCGVFVSSSKGSDTTGKGTKEQPYKTLGDALAKANGQPVYACGETFTEAVTLSASATLYGALVCSQIWMYDATQKTKLTAVADAIPLRLASTAGGTVVHDFAITAVDAVMAGGSSIAVLDDHAGVTLENVDVTAGKGATGAAGMAQGAAMTPAMANGIGGTADAMCNVSGPIAGGGGGKNTCGGTSPNGGLGGSGVADISGGDGSGGKPVMMPSNAGTGQTTTMACQPGGQGALGTVGTAGTGARGIGDVSTAGYAGATGVLGSAGGAGQGGGGGGGALACDSPTDMFAGPSGGGGGAGGCGGASGNLGQSGGSSIGILALGAMPTFKTVSITTHAGGVGGTGGNGQPGGAGGKQGGAGGSASCAGGNGGQGGAGGPGGGGAGGHSVAVAAKGAPLPDLSSAKIVHGSGAAGGAGGDMDMTAQTKGDAGLGCKTLDFTNPMSPTACVM